MGVGDDGLNLTVRGLGLMAGGNHGFGVGVGVGVDFF